MYQYNINIYFQLDLSGLGFIYTLFLFIEVNGVQIKFVKPKPSPTFLRQQYEKPIQPLAKPKGTAFHNISVSQVVAVHQDTSTTT